MDVRDLTEGTRPVAEAEELRLVVLFGSEARGDARGLRVLPGRSPRPARASGEVEVTELDRALVRRKLSTILEDLEDLEAVEGLSVDAFRTDRFRQKGAERMLQEVVEAAVDINLHLLRLHGGPEVVHGVRTGGGGPPFVTG